MGQNLLENRRVYTDNRRKDLLQQARKLSAKAEWTKIRLDVIAEMLDENGEDWFATQIRGIAEEIELFD